MWLVYLWCKHGLHAIPQIQFGGSWGQLESNWNRYKELSLWLIMRGHYKRIDEKFPGQRYEPVVSDKRGHSNSKHPCQKKKEKSLPDSLLANAKKHTSGFSTTEIDLSIANDSPKLCRGGQLGFNTHHLFLKLSMVSHRYMTHSSNKRHDLSTNKILNCHMFVWKNK